MAPTSLDDWSVAVRSSWGPLSSELIDDCRRYLERLAMAPAGEDWLASLHRDQPAARELYRDPDHGFVLLAHTEAQGLYRPPHDHGASWVIYAVLQGEVEMGTYARLPEPDGGHRLVKRDSTTVTAGEVRVYLPGDIHDTLCVSGPALLLRFTERDLQIEKEERRMTRYTQHDGIWMAAA
jgi:predicted metal-dependent enzyme (double-stranded beta helix superfamily)